jgi:flavodoxin
MNMKSIVVYSSVTGNTKMIAEALAEKLEAKQTLFSGERAPIDVECDLIAVGFWVNRGNADLKKKKYLEQLEIKTLPCLQP